MWYRTLWTGRFVIGTWASVMVEYGVSRQRQRQQQRLSTTGKNWQRASSMPQLVVMCWQRNWWCRAQAYFPADSSWALTKTAGFWDPRWTTEVIDGGKWWQRCKPTIGDDDDVMMNLMLDLRWFQYASGWWHWLAGKTGIAAAEFPRPKQ